MGLCGNLSQNSSSRFVFPSLNLPGISHDEAKSALQSNDFEVGDINNEYRRFRKPKSSGCQMAVTQRQQLDNLASR